MLGPFWGSIWEIDKGEERPKKEILEGFDVGIDWREIGTLRARVIGSMFDVVPTTKWIDE